MKSKKLITASWCGPCKLLKAEIESRDLSVETLQAEDNQELAKEFGIRSVPTLLVQNGDDYDLIIGNDKILEVLSD